MQIPEPAASRRTLKKAAGAIWMLVGLLMSARALFWLRGTGGQTFWLAVPALIVEYLKGRYIFSRLAANNIARIDALSPEKERVCIFAFQAVNSYVLVIAMVTLGILLRFLSLPREWLAAIYLAIGSGLSVAGTRYWQR